MVFETNVGEHKILNDVPPTPDWGGKGRHPTPPDYFVASLSSCIAAFVVQYCNQVGLDWSDMSVEISYEKATDPAHLRDLAVNINLPNAEIGARAEASKRVRQMYRTRDNLQDGYITHQRVRQDCGS
jgi:uncharacterized OsmC-like protein